MLKKQRYHYIDIIKGLCICLVIVRHAPFVMSFAENPYMDIFWLKNFFISFFMAAFFMATGFCSSFNISFRDFLWKNIKGILLPAFCLYYFNRWIVNIDDLIYADNPTWITVQYWFTPGIRTFISEGGFYWFFSALFWAKLTMWGLCRIDQNRVRIIVSIAISICAVCISTRYPQYNYFFFFNAAVLLPFMMIGKSMNADMKGGAIVAASFFFISAIVLSFVGIEAPSVGRTIEITLRTYPLFFLMSTTGCLTIFTIAKYIERNKVLEYMGKGSLVIYAFNISVLNLVGHTIIRHVCNPVSPVLSIIVFLSIMGLALVVLTFLYYLLNHKYIRVVLGKF